MLPISIESNLAELTAAIRQTIALSGKTVAEVVDRKTRSLGIRLFGAFRERQWGGNVRRRGIAREELDARAAQGKGIKVRQTIIDRMDARRKGLGQARVDIFARRRAGTARANDERNLRRNFRARANLWREAVGRELKARERGIGVLAASFLWYRRRSSQARGTYYVRNRSGRSLGYLESADGVARIVAETPGVARVADRYGIVSSAIQAETADTLEFGRRRYLGIFEEARRSA